MVQRKIREISCLPTMLSLLSKGKLFGLFITIIYLASAVVTNDFTAESTSELKRFKHCMRQTPQLGLRGCVGRTALNFIQRFDEQDNFTFIDDFIMTKSEQAATRSLGNLLDTDPVDFRGILESAGAVMGQRSLEWHMDRIYPGLMFKIGPTADTNSVAEFVIDPTAVDERQFNYEEPSAARVLTQQYLLPFLLGLKFNLVALVPLLFAGICLLLKKSLFFAKLAIYISSFLGIGGALGALGSFGGGGLGGAGLGGLGGLFGAPPPIPGLYRPPIGHFPGKTTVYGHYDEMQQQPQPYKRRADRKLKFEEQRAYAATPAATTAATTPARDNFYDYERSVLLHENNDSKQRTLRNARKLGPSAAYEAAEAAELSAQIQPQLHNFHENDARNGWQVVDLRVN